MSFDDEHETTEAHERRITRCRSCRARIIFLRTSSGKSMPVDADTVEPDDELFEYGRHVSHFSTCAQADQHRRGDGRTHYEGCWRDPGHHACAVAEGRTDE